MGGGSRIYITSCEKLEDVHGTAGQCFVSLSAGELVQKRCESVARVLSRLDIGFDPSMNISISQVKDFLGVRAMDFFNNIPRIWQYRLLTSSYQFRDGDTMYFGEGGNAFGDKNNFDYTDISDGGVKVKRPDQLHLDGSIGIPITDYLAARGGDMSHRDLQGHPIFRAIIPDKNLRQWYVTCLRILDYFSIADKGMQSLWRPGEMRSGYLRWIALGFKGVAVYPPNATTRCHKVACVLNKNILPKPAKS